jgi:hypothetical protein
MKHALSRPCQSLNKPTGHVSECKNPPGWYAFFCIETWTEVVTGLSLHDLVRVKPFSSQKHVPKNAKVFTQDHGGRP